MIELTLISTDQQLEEKDFIGDQFVNQIYTTQCKLCAIVIELTVEKIDQYFFVDLGELWQRFLLAKK